MLGAGSEGSSIEVLLRSAAGQLLTADVDTPLLDAQLLLAQVLGCSRLDVIAHPERLLTDAQLARFMSLVEKRTSRYPLAYILGCREFYGIEIDVSPGVLIPRPETEVVVSTVLAGLHTGQPLIADIGAGSGAIAIALAMNLPSAHIYATEISEEALKVARANLKKHDLSERVSLMEGDVLDPIAGLGFEFDAIASNPPYIPSGEIESLQPEISLYEPREALDGGRDGLDVYRRLLPGALGVLRTGGFCAVEVGAGQAPAVCEIAQRAGYREIRIVPDLARIERVVIAFR